MDPIQFAFLRLLEDLKIGFTTHPLMRPGRAPAIPPERLPESALQLTPDNKVDILLARFTTHVETLRAITGFDLQIFVGYVTLQVSLAGWFAKYPIDELQSRIGVSVVMLSIAGLASQLLYNNYRRRKQVAAGLARTLGAMRMAVPDDYLRGESLDVETPFRPWLPWYLVGIAVCAAGVGLVVWGAT